MEARESLPLKEGKYDSGCACRLGGCRLQGWTQREGGCAKALRAQGAPEGAESPTSPCTWVPWAAAKHAARAARATTAFVVPVSGRPSHRRREGRPRKGDGTRNGGQGRGRAGRPSSSTGGARLFLRRRAAGTRPLLRRRPVGGRAFLCAGAQLSARSRVPTGARGHKGL